MGGDSGSGLECGVGVDREKIVNAVRCLESDNPRPKLYGDGSAAEKIIHHLTAHQLT